MNGHDAGWAGEVEQLLRANEEGNRAEVDFAIGPDVYQQSVSWQIQSR